ncbi:MAG: hypothetical protein JWL83_392 [Actinomycetia bacterium]|nr:hypothetical protein [Actinomycetes bacterium]
MNQEDAAPSAKRTMADERGMAAVWMALTLFVLLGVSAIAVDLVHAILVQQETQNAADAASLGGVVFLPADPANAVSRAQAIASSNGFTNGVNGTVVSATQQAVPSRLKVDVKRSFPTLFARVLGFNSLTVHKSAIADYDQPVAMGSPSNTFGNQPDCSNPCTNSPGSENPQLWFNVAGPLSTKVSGDAFTSTLCNVNGTTPDNCPGTANGNTDYDGKGYDYVVHDSGTSGLVDIQVFDPAFVGVNDKCDDPSLAALYASTGNNPRYATGSASQYCTGDQYFSYSDPYANKPPPTTQYTVTWDPGTPWTTSDDTFVCSKTFTGFKDAQTAYADTSNGRPNFRQWVSICPQQPAQPGSAAGDYLLNVNTLSGAGHNRGAIRAKLNNSLNAPALSVYARSRMSLYANATASNPQFYLARVLPGSAGRTLIVTFYDTGDADLAGTIKVRPPADSNYLQFSKCEYTPPPGNSTGPPWGTYQATGGSDCSQSGVSSATDWNGQWVSWKVPIPGNYTCDATKSSGCWVKLQMSFPGGVADTTTWTASLSGNPVRLVQ